MAEISDTLKNALEALVGFYELWGFRLWYLNKILSRSSGTTEEQLDQLVAMGYAEKQHIVLADEIAKALEAGESEGMIEFGTNMSKLFLGDEWDQYRVTQAGLDYWDGFGIKTYLEKFINEIEGKTNE